MYCNAEIVWLSNLKHVILFLKRVTQIQHMQINKKLKKIFYIQEVFKGEGCDLVRYSSF